MGNIVRELNKQIQEGKKGSLTKLEIQKLQQELDRQIAKNKISDK